MKPIKVDDIECKYLSFQNILTVTFDHDIHCRCLRFIRGFILVMTV